MVVQRPVCPATPGVALRPMSIQKKAKRAAKKAERASKKAKRLAKKAERIAQKAAPAIEAAAFVAGVVGEHKATRDHGQR